MTTVAVVAHRKKSFGGGLSELRRLLAERGIDDPMWFEVPKSKKAPAKARRAVKEGAGVLLIWGGDGTVQRCLDAVAGMDVKVGILPAGTANLLAGNLGIPEDLPGALDVALYGHPRGLDLGMVNGEHFAVMAGAGFDAAMMEWADAGLKDRVGQLAYVWTGVRASRMPPVKMSIKVDGSAWYKGPVSCLLVGNMGHLTGGLAAFPDARPDDGQLDIGVVSASTPLQWARVAGRLVAGQADRSKLVSTTRARRVTVKLKKPTRYELDGGARDRVDRLDIRVHPQAVKVCVPSQSATGAVA